MILRIEVVDSIGRCGSECTRVVVFENLSCESTSNVAINIRLISHKYQFYVKKAIEIWCLIVAVIYWDVKD